MENERAWGRADQTGGHDDTLRAATEECDGRRATASPEQLEEEERDNAYDKAGFLSRSWSTATSISGRLGIEWRLRPLRTRSTRGARLSARACVADVPVYLGALCVSGVRPKILPPNSTQSSAQIIVTDVLHVQSSDLKQPRIEHSPGMPRPSRPTTTRPAH